MGALGPSQGRRFVLHPPTVGFAAHHATTITSCKARDAKRKGKVERPFRQLQETFLPEVELDGVPNDLAELNRRAERWINARVHQVKSRSTGEFPADRLIIERPFLSPLPRVRFDTDYGETAGSTTSCRSSPSTAAATGCPANVLGQLVEIRRPVDSREFTVAHAGRVVVTHVLKENPGPDIIWLPEHRAQIEAIAMAGRPKHDGRHLRLVAPATTTPTWKQLDQLELGDGDYDVEAPDLTERYGINIDIDIDVDVDVDLEDLA